MVRIYPSVFLAILYMNFMVIFAGRFKSPAIDFDLGNTSIGGDFNRPADMRNNTQMPFCPYAELLKILRAYILTILKNPEHPNFNTIEYLHSLERVYKKS